MEVEALGCACNGAADNYYPIHQAVEQNAAPTIVTT